MSLCPICRGLDESLPLDQGVTYTSLLHSADQGCHTCNLLIRSVNTIHDADSGTSTSSIVVAWDTVRIVGLRVVVGRLGTTTTTTKAGGSTDPVFLHSLDIFARPGDTLPWKLRNKGECVTEIPRHTGSDDAISRIQQWIDLCDRDHDCRSGPYKAYFSQAGSSHASSNGSSATISNTTRTSLLPTRVLDISSPNIVKLFCPPQESKDAPGTLGRYACLSHCWGTHLSITTTKSTLSAFQTEIPWDSLPPTFQDAITVCRRLVGINYIWVDALCIVQDDWKDWHRESGSMAYIYSNAYLTIAASSASSGVAGFLAETPDCYHAQKITYHSHHRSHENNNEGHTGEGNEGDKDDIGKTSTATIHIRRTLTHGQGPTPLPLLRRAWVLQERLLSPRIIHFAPEELIWECMRQTTCSCGCIRHLCSPGFVPFDKGLLHGPLLTASANRAEMREKWHRLVEEYSMLALTFEKDRLPAISGAARMFGHSWGSGGAELLVGGFLGRKYIAGCWYDGLLRDVMWRRLEPDLKKARRLKEVPSWTWAGTEAYVGFDTAMSTTLEASLLSTYSHQQELHATDEFGVEKELIISISGQVAPVKLVFCGGTYRLKGQTGDDGDEAVITEAREFLPDSLEALSTPAKDCNGEQAGLYVLKVATQHNIIGDREGMNQQVSLVLKLIGGMGTTGLYGDDYTLTVDYYERVGILRLAFDGLQVPPERDIYGRGVESTKMALR